MVKRFLLDFLPVEMLDPKREGKASKEPGTIIQRAMDIREFVGVVRK